MKFSYKRDFKCIDANLHQVVNLNTNYKTCSTSFLSIFYWKMNNEVKNIEVLLYNCMFSTKVYIGANIFV